ncbi:hypothetical protein Gotri_015760, partial [Gossypium trilobum]|nr:hypothetical protein [Gossypium trilobum]
MKHQDNSKDWFNVICNKTVNGKKVPFLNINGTDLQILDFDFFKGTIMAPAFTIQIPTTSFGLQVAPSCRFNNEASSIVGCRVNIPQGLSSFYVNMSSRVDSSDYKRKRSCGFASMISSDYHLTSELEDIDISNRTHIPTQLQWGTLISGVCQLNDGLDTSCTFDG